MTKQEGGGGEEKRKEGEKGKGGRKRKKVKEKKGEGVRKDKKIGREKGKRGKKQIQGPTGLLLAPPRRGGHSAAQQKTLSTPF